MADPITFVPKPTLDQVIREEALRVIREVLAELENGKVVSVIVIANNADGTWEEVRSGIHKKAFPDAIGRLEIIKQRWIADCLEEDEIIE